MRSVDVHRAVNQQPNRFALCHMVAQSTRLLHLEGGPIGQTITQALDGVYRGTILRTTAQESEPRAELETTVLFSSGRIL